MYTVYIRGGDELVFTNILVGAVMSCGCNSRNQVQSWNDLLCQMPTDPRDVLAIARLGGTNGTWLLSSDYHRPPGSSVWIPSPIVYSGDVIVTTNSSDNSRWCSRLNRGT